MKVGDKLPDVQAVLATRMRRRINGEVVGKGGWCGSGTGA